MARAGGPGGGSDPGNSGGGSPGGRSGGSTGGGNRGGFGRDTPGSPNAADGKRGSTMGRDGGTATGRGGGGPGRDTPGAPENEGRRGAHAEGSTPASRARSAMARHDRERSEQAGYNEGYSLVGQLKAAEEDGTMTPRQRDMAIGMEAGMESKGFMDVASGMLSRGITAVTDTMGLGKLGAKAAESGMNAASVPNNPESRYGAAVARRSMDNSMVQDAAQAAAGLLGGPVAGMAVGAVNTAANLNANKDIASLNSDIDAREAASRPSRPANTGGGSIGAARDAMSRNSARTASAPGRPNFEWSPVDLTKYRKGLISPFMS